MEGLRMKLVLLVIAAWATIWSTAAFFTGFDSDFRVAATIAVACLATIFYLDHRTAERARAAHARDDWRGIEDEYEIESLREID
jgi:hypothetical protein